MEYKKGDIVTAEFVVLREVMSIEGQAWLDKVSDWKLVRRALDLSKPVRFVSGPSVPILRAYPSSEQGAVIVEIGKLGDSAVTRYQEYELENIPEDEL